MPRLTHEKIHPFFILPRKHVFTKLVDRKDGVSQLLKGSISFQQVICENTSSFAVIPNTGGRVDPIKGWCAVHLSICSKTSLLDQVNTTDGLATRLLCLLIPTIVCVTLSWMYDQHNVTEERAQP
jgi:hypothetical protein